MKFKFPTTIGQTLTNINVMSFFSNLLSKVIINYFGSYQICEFIPKSTQHLTGHCLPMDHFRRNIGRISDNFEWSIEMERFLFRISNNTNNFFGHIGPGKVARTRTKCFCVSLSDQHVRTIHRNLSGTHFFPAVVRSG